MSDTLITVIYLAPRATNTALNRDTMNQMNRELGNVIDEHESVAKQVVKALTKGKQVNRYLSWPEAFFVWLNSPFLKLVDKVLARQLATIKRYCSAEG